MTKIEKELSGLGYQPANFKCGGEVWTPKQAGILEPEEFGVDIVVQPVEPPIAIIKTVYTDKGTHCDVSYKTLAIYSSVQDLQYWLADHGKLSGPGITCDQGVYD